MNPDPAREPARAMAPATPGPNQRRSSKWLDLKAIRDDRRELLSRIAACEIRLAMPAKVQPELLGDSSMASYSDYLDDMLTRASYEESLRRHRRALDRLYRLRAHHRNRVHGETYRDWSLGGVKRQRTLMDERAVLGPLIRQYAIPGRYPPSMVELALTQLVRSLKDIKLP